MSPRDPGEDGGGGGFSPGGSSLKELLAEGGPKNCSLSRDSGTGLTMNLRPAEWTTWAARLGGAPEGGEDNTVGERWILWCVCVWRERAGTGL